MAESRSRRTVLAAKIEATPGVAETLAAADANLLVSAVKFTPDFSLYERKINNVSMSPYAAIVGTRAGTVSFTVELRGSGTAGTAPAIGKLLRACGMDETVVLTTSVAYEPSSLTNTPTLTIGVYKDLGVRKLLKGCRGNWRLVSKIGEPLLLEFSFTGVYESVTDQSVLSGTGIETTIPPKLQGVSPFTIGAFSPKVSAFTLEIGNTLFLRPDIASASGFATCLITERMPKGSMDPEEELVASYDWYGQWSAGTLAALAATVGSTAGNICAITAPKLQIAKLDEVDSSGLDRLPMDFLCVRNAAGGDDELSLLFT